MMSQPFAHEFLTGIPQLKAVMNILAALDIVMLPEEEDCNRLHHRVAWPDASVAVYNVDNGGGDHLFLAFTSQGCIIKGFDHESPLSPHALEEYGIYPGIYDEVPPVLLAVLEDAMFEREDVTLCIWRSARDTSWLCGSVEPPEGEEDGSDFLLGYLNPTAESYKEWAEDYYDVDIPLPALEKIYAGEPLTAERILELNPERDAAEALEEISAFF